MSFSIWKFWRTYPPTAPINMSPLTSFAGTSSFLANSQAPAQNVAIQVPARHPEPVMSPSSLCPFVSLTTVVPSETQSMAPVRATTHPNNLEICIRGRHKVCSKLTFLPCQVLDKCSRVSKSNTNAINALGLHLEE